MAGLRGSGKLGASSLRSRAVVVGGRALALAALCALACAARAAGEPDALGEPGANGAATRSRRRWRPRRRRSRCRVAGAGRLPARAGAARRARRRGGRRAPAAASRLAEHDASRRPRARVEPEAADLGGRARPLGPGAQVRDADPDRGRARRRRARRHALGGRAGRSRAWSRRRSGSSPRRSACAGCARSAAGSASTSRSFDAQRFHPDWEPVSSRAYYAPVSAFSANYSSFRIDIAPGEKVGAPAIVRLAPALPYFRTAAEAVTLRGGGQLGLDVDVLPDGSGESVRVTGALSADRAASTYWRAIALPERYAGAVLRQQLEAQGVRVGAARADRPRARDGARAAALHAASRSRCRSGCSTSSATTSSPSSSPSSSAPSCTARRPPGRRARARSRRVPGDHWDRRSRAGDRGRLGPVAAQPGRARDARGRDPPLGAALRVRARVPRRRCRSAAARERWRTACRTAPCRSARRPGTCAACRRSPAWCPGPSGTVRVFSILVNGSRGECRRTWTTRSTRSSNGSARRRPTRSATFRAPSLSRYCRARRE